MRLHLTRLAVLGLLVASLGVGCKKAAPPAAPTTPKAAAEAEPMPAEAPPVAKEAAPAADEVPAAAADPAAEVLAQRAAKAAVLEAERAARPAEEKVGEEGGTTDCEGGVQYDKLSLAEQQAEMARREAEVAMAKVQETEGKVDALLIEALKRQSKDCKADALDAVCVGAASGDPQRCSTQLNVGSQEECRTLATFRKAVISKDASGCAGIASVPVRAMCVGGASGKYECPEADTSKEAQTCRLLAKGGEPECDAAKDEAEVCGSFWMLHAMAKQDATICDKVPGEAMSGHCRAIATGDASKCAGGGAIPKGCREVMLTTDVQEVAAPEGPRFLARMRAFNLYDEVATCKVVLSVRHGSQDITMEKEMGSLTPGGEIRTYTWPLEGVRTKPVVLAGTRCTWEPYVPQAAEVPAAP